MHNKGQFCLAPLPVGLTSYHPGQGNMHRAQLLLLQGPRLSFSTPNAQPRREISHHPELLLLQSSNSGVPLSESKFPPFYFTSSLLSHSPGPSVPFPSLFSLLDSSPFTTLDPTNSPVSSSKLSMSPPPDSLCVCPAYTGLLLPTMDPHRRRRREKRMPVPTYCSKAFAISVSAVFLRVPSHSHLIPSPDSHVDFPNAPHPSQVQTVSPFLLLPLEMTLFQEI